MKYLSIVIFIMLVFSFPTVAFEATADLSNSDSLRSQTDMGGFLTQAIKEISRVDAAFLCSTGIKKEIYKGSFDISSVSDLFYYPDDKILILELTGKEIKEVMEKCVEDYPRENSDFLQVSGITGSFNPSLPSDGRIVSIYVNGVELTDNSRYRVALDETLAGGFSGYTVFARGKVLERTSLSLKDILEQYIQTHSVIGKPADWGLKPI